MQETELSLGRLASGLSELSTMKTDLSQYVAASDTALLEQQLEQLHSQWEELCMKVRAHTNAYRHDAKMQQRKPEAVDRTGAGRVGGKSCHQQ